MYLVLVKHTGLYTLGKQRIPCHLLGIAYTLTANWASLLHVSTYTCM